MGFIGIAVFQIMAFVVTWLAIYFGSKMYDNIDIFPDAFVMAIFVWFAGFIWGSIAGGLLSI